MTRWAIENTENVHEQINIKRVRTQLGLKGLGSKAPN
jgi:hypothetical protein